MDWAHWPPVRRARRRVRAVDVAVDATVGFVLHQSGRNAAVLAYYGFLTLFPLIMVATTVLGFVLQGRPELETDIVDTALAQIPVLGQQLELQAGRVDGSVVALIVGLAAALWGSTRAFAGLQTALDDIWEVPIPDRPNIVVRRIHSLVGVLVIGSAQVAMVTVTAVAGWADVGAISIVFILIGVLIVNTVVVGTMFRYLTAANVGWSMVKYGAILSGVSYTILQVFGTSIMTRLLSGAQSVYGAFASVLAITGWLSIHAEISLYSAEINAVIAARRR